MGSIRQWVALSLVTALVGCGGGGGSDDNTPAPTQTNSGDPRQSQQTSTTMNVTLDLPPSLVASSYSAFKLKAMSWSLLSQAVAAPVPGARMLVVLAGADGVVTKVLGPEDGLVVNDNGNGTYTVKMPGDPTVNGMVVADPSGGAQIEPGFTLPDGTFYSPASGGDITVSAESTVATRVALNYIDSFDGISSAELSTLVDTLSRIAAGISARMSEMDMGQLQADLTAATGDYLQNAVAQAKLDLLFDASGYVGDYISLSVLQSLHTSATGSYVDLRSGYQQRGLSATIPLPAATTTTTTAAALDLSKLDFSYDETTSGTGALDSQLIQTSGTTRRSLSYVTDPLSLLKLPVNYDGAIVVDVPQQARTFTGNAANEVQLYPLKSYFYGSDQTIGGLFLSARRDVFDSLADGAEIQTEIAIKRSVNFDTANLGGSYGALISTTTVGVPLTKIRGLQFYNSTAGAFTASTPLNRTTIIQRANGSVESSTAATSFGPVVATANFDADGSLSATLGGRTYQGAANSDGRLVHLVAADPSGTAGFATLVKLAPSTTITDVSSKRYALFGALDKFAYGVTNIAAVSGFLGLSDSTTIQYVDDAEAVEFSGVAVDHLAAATRSHSAFVNTQNLFDIAVNSNGSVSFNYADHQVQGFVQAGGDLLILHDVRTVDASGTLTHQVEDRYYYAICFIGCTTTPAPGLFTIGGEVSNLAGSLGLRLNSGEVLTVSTGGPFSFVTPQTYGSAYSVDIATQPATQSCTVVNGAGSVTGNIDSISVACSNLYSIGGTVAGLNGTLVLQNGTEKLNVTANGAFTFANRVGEAAPAYAVTIATQPAGQVCTLTGGSGNAAANVTNIAVSCASQYAVSGTLSGLTSGSVVVALGAETLTLSANGAFNFINKITSGANYAVSVTSSPAGQICTVANGSGTATANVTNITVSCASQYSVSGTLSGLTSGSVSVALGAETLTLNANGTFNFANKITSGASYAVGVTSSPAGQTCTVTNGSGTIAANVTNVQVSCAASI